LPQVEAFFTVIYATIGAFPTILTKVMADSDIIQKSVYNIGPGQLEMFHSRAEQGLAFGTGVAQLEAARTGFQRRW
jgi:hypothetical protein